MFLLVLAHPGCPGQNPESRKMVVVVVVIVSKIIKSLTDTTTTTAVLWPFFWDYPVELVPEETFTHSHLS